MPTPALPPSTPLACPSAVIRTPAPPTDRSRSTGWFLLLAWDALAADLWVMHPDDAVVMGAGEIRGAIAPRVGCSGPQAVTGFLAPDQALGWTQAHSTSSGNHSDDAVSSPSLG